MLTKGTPKTLVEAIDNGVKDWEEHCGGPEILKEKIERHITDYLAQKFGAALLTAALVADSNDTETLIATLARDCGLKVK